MTAQALSKHTPGWIQEGLSTNATYGDIVGLPAFLLASQLGVFKTAPTRGSPHNRLGCFGAALKAYFLSRLCKLRTVLVLVGMRAPWNAFVSAEPLANVRRRYIGLSPLQIPGKMEREFGQTGEQMRKGQGAHQRGLLGHKEVAGGVVV